MEDIIVINSNDVICEDTENYLTSIGEQMIQDYILEVYTQMNRVYHSLDINEAYGSDLKNFLNKM